MEERDLLAGDERPAAVEAAFAELRGAVEQSLAGGTVLDPADAPIDPDLEERPRSLGYLD